MSLNTFLMLNEGELANKASLIVQAFIDNVGSAHYEIKDGGMLRFNVGKTIKISRYADLCIVIRESDSSAIRLGKDSSDKFVIVIDVPDLPSVTEVEQFLEKTEIMGKVIECVEQFIEIKKSYKGEGSEISTKQMSKYEKSKHYNSREKFESVYQNLVKALREKMSDLEKITSNFESQIEQTGNTSRRVTLELAIEKLKSEYLGKNEKEFIGKAYKVLDEMEPGFRENLEKENKNMLDDRLRQFYEEL